MNQRRTVGWALASVVVLLWVCPAQAAERNNWHYDGGYFESVGDNRWEQHNGDKRYSFIEKERTEKYVEMYESSLHITVRLYDDHQEDRSPGKEFHQTRKGGWGAKQSRPSTFDLCKDQTPIRNQGARPTCPYFPAVAALEAAYKRAGVEVELSPEHLTWLRNVTSEDDSVKPGAAEDMWSAGGFGGASVVIHNYAVCLAKDMPYHGEESYEDPASNMYKGYELAGYHWDIPFSQFVLNRWNISPKLLTPQVRADSLYGADEVVSLSKADLRDPNKFEEVLATGHEIIFNYKPHSDSDDAAKGEPVWRLKPGTAAHTNHNMLIVGYDRPRHFFVVKNSYGPVHYAPDKLAKGWKDIVKYEGFTLLDYNYLDTCGEAWYIDRLAPVGSPRYAAQRALGQWSVAFERNHKSVMSGVLCWRRVSLANMNDWRIGDLVTRDGKLYRVNAELDGDGTKPCGLTLWIDFAQGTLTRRMKEGSTWKGKLTLPEHGDGSFQLEFSPGSAESPWGTTRGMQLTAHQNTTTNLLQAMTAPKFSP